jgi:hypothetical protein
MDKEKLKLIISNLEILLVELREEVYSDTDDQKYKEIASYVADYDEVFYGDDND